MKKRTFNGDILITDPCYIIRDDRDEDWTNCGFGVYLKHLGITNHLTRGTIYGDWGCSVFKLKNPLGKRSIRSLEPEDFEEEILGRFCADAGMVTVALLDEVLKYNPNFNYHTSRPWTATVIKDFHGDVYDKVINRELFLVGEEISTSLLDRQVSNHT